jgi:hypothetical protein
VTVDEYLQLRAILSKVPGAKLYVYKNAFDAGYTLELNYGHQEPVVVNYLMPSASGRYGFMMGIRQYGSQGKYSPVGMWVDSKVEKDGSMVVYTTSVHPTPSVDFQKLDPKELGDDLLVYVNREKIDLVKGANVSISTGSGLKATDVSVKVNGVDVSTLGAASWPEIVVEGRQLPEPLKRLERLLKIEVPYEGGLSIVSSGTVDGTFRQWYDDLRFLKDQPILTYYNDRPVTLDFLLDTEFGDNAMIQHGVIFDTNMGRYALQVFDDYPDVKLFLGKPPEKNSPNGPNEDAGQVEVMTATDLATLYDGKTVELDLFLKRLPMPLEVDQINAYLEQLVQKKINVFQDCTKPEGDYSLQLSTEGTSFFGFEGWPAGSRQENPVRLQMRKDGSGGMGHATFRPTPLPEGAPNADVLLRINGAWVSVYSAAVVPYTSATLDPGPLKVKLRCLLDLNPDNVDEYNVWTATRTSFSYSTVGEEVRELLQSQELEGVPIRYFIGEGEVAADVFARLPAVKEIKLSMASRTEGPDDRVVARVD